MMKASQANLLPHSEAKVDLLKRYLGAYVGILANNPFTDVVEIYDYFCGVGVFVNEKHGSPLVITQVICDFLKKNPGNTTRFKCHFNDRDAAKIEALEPTIRAIVPKNETRFQITFGNENYLELLPKVIAHQKISRKTKFFHFIDPYGYKDVCWSQIRTLLVGSNSEVLLFQPSTFLYRFKGKATTPDALKKFMDELGDDSHWPEGGDAWSHIAATTSLFRSNYPEGFVDSFTIEKDKGTIYCLFFFTSHILGFEKMLEAKWTLNDSTGRGWHYEVALTDDLFAKKPTPQVKELKDLIYNLFAESGSVTNGVLYEQTLRAGFLPKHSKLILETLEKAGRLRKMPDLKKGAFLINYDNAMKIPRIINFSLLP